MNSDRWAIEVIFEIEGSETIGLERGSRTQLSQGVRSAVAAVLADQQSDEAEVSVVLTNNERVKTLNRTYRGVDRVTDVLSFAAREGGDDTFGMPAELAAELGTNLGDLFIALPYAIRKAEQYGHSLNAELTLLAVHGSLHLLGFDHGDAESTDRMWAVQERILAALLDEDLSHRIADEAAADVESQISTE